MKRAVLFDMDGLMVESKFTWVEAERKLVEEYGKKYSEEIAKKYHGLRVNGMIKVMIQKYDLPLSEIEGENKLKLYAKNNFNKPNVTLLPGCENLIKALFQSKKYYLAVASSSPKDIIKTVVQKFGFENYFDVLVSGEEVTNGKPAPDIVLRATELLKTPPRSCLVLEDAPNGIKAAKAAGMKTIAVNHNPNYTERNLTEADEYFKSLN